MIKDKPIDPEAAQRYLEKAFGDDLPRVREAMAELVASFDPEEIGERAYGLYTVFRPAIPKGKKGWGAKGELDPDAIRAAGKSG